MINIYVLGASAVVAVVVVFVFILSSCVRYVGNNRVAIVEKLWSRNGSISDGFIALANEAGYQPAVLRGGYHFFMPFQYRVHSSPLVTIPQGQIGYVFARDGAPLGPTQTLASNATTADFLDVHSFLKNGGQKGPQRTVLREGTYAINLAQFVVITRDQIHGLMLENNDRDLFVQMQSVIEERDGFAAVVIKDASDQIGVVTVHDGPALTADQIIAPEVGTDQSDSITFHNSFQDPEKFIAAGGRRGRQLQVLVEGSYYINRLFATVEMIAKTVIDVGHVGVVVSYTGESGTDTSGDEYRHGELVQRGSRGVWSEPLLPGKYAFNTYAGKILVVPTTNFILKWDQDVTGQHKLDENLSEVSLITRDAFEPTLPLSVVVHIDYRKAPLVIQRFGDIKKLVEQTLDPMVSAYFKNVAQRKTLIELLQDRSDIQEQAGQEMRAKFGSYNLELQEVLIGTPRPRADATNDQIEKVLQQLRERQVAEERVTTYQKQRVAAESEKALREAEARAHQQTSITESELSITVQENQGKAALKRATQDAEQTRTLAKAEADRIRIVGEGEAAKTVALAGAEAERITRTGLATAEAIEKQAAASGGAQFQLTRQVIERLADALEKSGVDIVPRVQISTGGGADSAGGMQALIGMLLSEKGMAMLTGPQASAAGKAKAKPVIAPEEA
ncbi:MAG: flotillin family protein [Sphingobium sp.]|nr:flotillin family protein [Sphingobium sp.]